jgi:cytochrome c-type biogenesis protein CcmE
MTPRRQRMVFVGVLVAGVAVATVLVFKAMGENMLYFFSPTQVLAGEAPRGHDFRVGGLVVNGSVKHIGDGLTVQFDLTDTAHTVTVLYTGILPDLFREGQGIVAMGRLGRDGVFDAQQVLAKHDEKYMPPEVADALKMAKQGGRMQNPHAGVKP